MRTLIFTLILFSCSHKERPLQERQLVQCYLESDTYAQRKPFQATVKLQISQLGTVESAKVTETSEKDANLNTCLSYVLTGAGRSLQSAEKAGPTVKNLKFTPEGKHEL